MILSASRRTDIPCYYSEWFMNRIRAGYVLTRNPMNHAQLSRIPLSPDIVDCIVFWTKDAANMLPHLDELDKEESGKVLLKGTLTKSYLPKERVGKPSKWVTFYTLLAEKERDNAEK